MPTEEVSAVVADAELAVELLARGWRIALLEGRADAVAWDGEHAFLAYVPAPLVRMLTPEAVRTRRSLQEALTYARLEHVARPPVRGDAVPPRRARSRPV